MYFCSHYTFFTVIKQGAGICPRIAKYSVSCYNISKREEAEPWIVSRSIICLGCLNFTSSYRVFLPLYCTHRDWFYPWCDIASLYGAPADCLWGGGRVGGGDVRPQDALALATGIRHLGQVDVQQLSTASRNIWPTATCNKLCRLFAACDTPQSGVIVHSELLLDYLQRTYPSFYFVSSTTKVLTEFSQLAQEAAREEFPLCGAGFPPE